MVSYPSKPTISYIVRGVQFVFAIIVLGLGARLATLDYTTGRAGLNVAVAVLTIIYLPALFIPAVATRIPNLILLVIEAVLFILWLSAMAAIADAGYGRISCGGSYYYYSDFRSACHAGKALTAFSVLEFILFIASLALLSYFVAFPNRSTLTSLSANDTYHGALFSRAGPAHIDEEAKVESEEENKEPVIADDQSPATDLETAEPIEPVEPAVAPAESDLSERK